MFGKPVADPTDPRTRGVVGHVWKYLRAPDSDQLFRLPDEVQNFSATDEETLRRLRNALDAEQDRFPARAPAAEADDDRAGGPRNGTFHIYASASGSAATVAAIEAVVRISRTSKAPFTIVDWREPPRVEFPPREGGQG